MSARAMTAAERLVKKHGGTLNAGGFDRAAGLTQEAAKALVEDLRAANYQVIRAPFEVQKDHAWTVIFR